MRKMMISLAAATCAFSASAAYALRDHQHEGGDVAAYGCLALPAPTAPPRSGTWLRTVDAGPHDAQVRRAVEAFNKAGTALRVRIVKRGARADVTVTQDRDLPGNSIGVTRGCLSPGRISAVATVTMDQHFPAGLDETLALTRGLAVAFGLRANDRDRCSTMATVQNRTLAGCGDGYALLQPVDRRALRRVWGPAAGRAPAHQSG